MQAQVKYESEIKTAVLERRLFDVFRKYAGRG